MVAEISVDPDAGLIAVREHGVISTEGFEATVAGIKEAHERTGIARVLVDVRGQVGIATGVALYERARHAAEMLGQVRMRIAIVVAEPLVEGHEFFATVSQNRGLSIYPFSDEGAALRWLAD